MAFDRKERFVKQGKSAMKSIQSVIDELDPVSTPDLDKAFQTYASFSGDIVKTAHVLDITPQQVAQMADEQKWAARLKSIFELRKSGSPQDVERAINRTVNFIMCHRMRIILDRIINFLYTKSGSELAELCITDRKDSEGNVIGQTMNLKPFTELAAALEKTQILTYYSLTDSPSERNHRKIKDPNEGMSLQELHSAIAEQMANAGAQKPVAALEAEAERQGEQAASE